MSHVSFFCVCCCCCSHHVFAPHSIANVVKLSGCAVPDWMLAMKKVCTRDKHRLETSAPKRHDIETVSNYDKRRNKRNFSDNKTPKTVTRDADRGSVEQSKAGKKSAVPK